MLLPWVHVGHLTVPQNPSRLIFKQGNGVQKGKLPWAKSQNPSVADYGLEPRLASSPRSAHRAIHSPTSMRSDHVGSTTGSSWAQLAGVRGRFIGEETSENL